MTRLQCLLQPDTKDTIWYTSLQGISLIWHSKHGMGVMPVAFLLIPKGKNYPMYSFDFHIYLSYLAQQKHGNKPAFFTFCCQLYHTCLMNIFQPLKAGMTSPETIHCPDGHWWCAIYGLGPYIANYPKQVFLAGIVQNWCPK